MRQGKRLQIEPMCNQRQAVTNIKQCLIIWSSSCRVRHPLGATMISVECHVVFYHQWTTPAPPEAKAGVISHE